MSSSSVSVDVPQRDVLGLAQALLQLTKPGVTRLVLLTMACGALVAPGEVEIGRLIVALAGTALVVAAANTLNMYLERDTDRLMERTRQRPLPSGRLSPEVALWFGIGLALCGLLVTTFAVNALTGLFAAVALVSYVLLYTPLKRVTPLALYIGAVPGAIPPVMGFTSMTGNLGIVPLLLFGILFVWQLPHFIAIAIFRCSEYERAGLQVLPVSRGLDTAKWQTIAYLGLLLVVSLLPVSFGLGGMVYSVIAAVSGLALFGWGLFGLGRLASDKWARMLFFASLPYLVVVFGALVISAS